jgi:hypothetical protein
MSEPDVTKHIKEIVANITMLSYREMMTLANALYTLLPPEPASRDDIIDALLELSHHLKVN